MVAQNRVEGPHDGEKEIGLQEDRSELESVFKSKFAVDEVTDWQSLLFGKVSRPGSWSLDSQLGRSSLTGSRLTRRERSLGLRVDGHVRVEFVVSPLVAQRKVLRRFSELACEGGGRYLGIALLVLKNEVEDEAR